MNRDGPCSLCCGPNGEFVGRTLYRVCTPCLKRALSEAHCQEDRRREALRQRVVSDPAPTLGSLWKLNQLLEDIA